MQLGILLAGIFGLSALILDAIGSHALSGYLIISQDEMNLVKQSWQTATKSQLVHALLLVYFSGMQLKQKQWNLALGQVLIVLGVILFCGGIYMKILTGIGYVGRLAPFGGVCFMLSWICLIVSAFRVPK